MAKKYSYIRYPYSGNGWLSFALSLVSLLLTAAVITLGILRKGDTGPFAGTAGFTAIVMGLMGMWFTFLSLTEKKKNRLFSYIGGGISFFVCVVWVLVIIYGQR